jgi:post-segregation antitoxin (ccd killing protein)
MAVLLKNGKKLIAIQVYLEESVKTKAKERGINFSKVFREAISEELSKPIVV